MSKRTIRDIELYIVDVFVAVNAVAHYTTAFQNAKELRKNSLHWDAVIRQLEVIGEAINKLLDSEQFASQAPSYFRKIVNFRNAISHGYFGIDADEVWSVVTVNLSKLESDLKHIVCECGIDLTDAVNSVLEELNDLGDCQNVEYLHQLIV